MPRVLAVTAVCALCSCGVAENSKAGDGDDGGIPAGDGDGGTSTGGVSNEDGYTGCFASFGLDPTLEIAQLDGAQQDIVCSAHEAMFYCINPEEQICLYEAAVRSLGAEDPMAACLETLEGLQNGSVPKVVEFECHTFQLPVCPGTLSDLETCFRDYLRQIQDRPLPPTWSCEHVTEVVNWTLMQVTTLPESCAPYDGCTL